MGAVNPKFLSHSVFSKIFSPRTNKKRKKKKKD